jgi:hypothetical protein
MVVYTPSDVESRIALDKLAAGEGTDAHFPCWPAHAPELAMAADTGIAVLRPVITVPCPPSPRRRQVKET